MNLKIKKLKNTEEKHMMNIGDRMSKCWKCHYNLGGLYCAVHGEVKLHESCEDFQELLIRLYPKPVHIGYDIKKDGLK